jgi:phosphonate transport system permease protein
MTGSLSDDRIPPRSIAWDKWGWLAAMGAFLAWSFSVAGGEILAVFTREGAAQFGSYLKNFWPPATDAAFLSVVAQAVLETLAISIGGTAIASVIAMGLLYFASSEELIGGGGEWEAAAPHQKTLRRALFIASRAALNLFRTIPEIVWAIFFVFAVGLGTFAGTLALGIHNAGVMGKLYAETLENTRRGPVEALRAGGATRFTAFAYGAVPQASSQLIAYTLYRWEVNIRAAAILGFVGAGGIGQQMYISISLFLDSRLATLTIATFILVNGVDLLSGYLRRRLEARF